VRPPAARTAAVSAWLSVLGASDVQTTANGEYVVARVRVGALSAALGGEAFRVFQHFRSGRRVVRAARAEAVQALPADVREAVDLVLGLRDFFENRRERFGQRDHLAPPASAAVAQSSSPLLKRVQGNESLLHLLVEPRCLDGKVPTTASSCFPKIARLVAKVTPSTGTSRTFSFKWAEAACSLNTIQNTTICNLYIPLRNAFERVNIEIETTFINGQASSPYILPTAYAPTQLTTPTKARGKTTGNMIKRPASPEAA
jgi:hypothetical protein